MPTTENHSPKRLTHFSTFTGIGGIDLSAEWAGFETVGQCEIDPFCQKVLAKHWPDVSRWSDIHEVTGESVRRRGIQGITLLSGGFPCQDISIAGKGAGLDGERSGLWFEMFRVIRELQPVWVIAENVGELVRRGLDRVLDGLEDAGYQGWPFLLEAADVGAWHKRERIFIVAHSCKIRQIQRVESTSRFESRQGGGAALSITNSHSAPRCQAQADTNSQKVCRHRRSLLETCQGGSTPWADRGFFGLRISKGRQSGVERFDSEPAVVRMVHGFPGCVDRIGALGNAVVPQQVYPILAAIAEIESMNQWLWTQCQPSLRSSHA
jgi:DNA (cytosine-5)-methyltransferase 1